MRRQGPARAGAVRLCWRAPRSRFWPTWVAQLYACLTECRFVGAAGAGGLCGAFPTWRPPSCWENGLIKEPRLRFTEEERADPALEKPTARRRRPPPKRTRRRQKSRKNRSSGPSWTPRPARSRPSWCWKISPRPPSKLSHTVRDAPGNAVAARFHQEIQESEDDNVGVESAHKSEEALETGVHLAREGYRSHKLKPYRQGCPGRTEAGKGQHRGAVPEIRL